MSRLEKSDDIPPNFGGVVKEPNENDVLSGRGGRINAHSGNVHYRELVKQYRGVYLSHETKKLDKAKIAAKIVTAVRNMVPPGRFLKEDKDGWVEIGDEKARKKAGQAMREKAPDSQQTSNKSPTNMDAMRNAQVPYAAYSQATSHSSSHSGSHPGEPHNFSGNPGSFPSGAMNSSQSYTLKGNVNSSLGEANSLSMFGMRRQPPNALSAPLVVNPAHSPPKPSPTHQSNGLIYGNAVAFDREFNRMPSSSSGSGRNSFAMSSMGSSMLTIARSSISSECSGADTGTGTATATATASTTVTRPLMGTLQPIHDVYHEDSQTSSMFPSGAPPLNSLSTNAPTSVAVPSGGTIPSLSIPSDSVPSSWNDSWDQPERSLSSQSSRSSRRKEMFKAMKDENCFDNTSLAPTRPVSELNESALLTESLASVEMQSCSDIRKSAAFMDRMSLNDMKMDSVTELIADAFDSDEEGSSGLTESKRKSLPSGMNSNTVRFEPPDRVTRGISDVSDISRAAAFQTSWGQMPALPSELSDSNRQRLYSDYSTR